MAKNCLRKKMVDEAKKRKGARSVMNVPKGQNKFSKILGGMK